MALDFPASPTTGQTFTGPNGVMWTWDGAKWVAGTNTGTTYAPIASPIFTGDPRVPTPPPGDNDTSIPTTAFVQAAVAPALNNVGRNLVHNPLFNVAQRGAGPFTTSNYTLDRWVQGFGAGDACSSSQVANNDTGRTQIGDEENNWLYDLIVTGAAGAANYVYTYQSIENVRRLAGKTITVSFYANSGTANFKVGVSIDQRFGTGGSPSAQVLGNGTAITLSSTAGAWARYSTTFAVPSIVGKTVGTNNDSSTGLNIWFSSGATNAARAGSIGVQSGTINLWGVQLEIGAIATPLEKPDPQQDLAKCQRFYQFASITSYRNNQLATGETTESASFAVNMRASPTVVVQSNTSVNMTFASVGGDRFSAFLSGSTTANGTTKVIAVLAASADL